MNMTSPETGGCLFYVKNLYIELEDVVEKGFEALINDKSQVKILVKLSGEK